MPSRTAFGQPTRQFIKIRSLPQAPEQYSKDDQDAIRRFIELAFVEVTGGSEFACCFHCQTGTPETVVSGTIGCIDQVTNAPLTTHPIWIKREADDGGMPPDDTIGWYGWNGLRGNRGVDTTFRIGDSAVVGNTSSYAIAIGDLSAAPGQNGVSIGKTQGAWPDEINIGRDNDLSAGTDVSRAVVIGNEIVLGAQEATDDPILIGFGISTGTLCEGGTVVIGQDVHCAANESVVIGTDAQAPEAVGDFERAEEVVVIGARAEGHGSCIVCIGHDSKTLGAGAQVAVGSFATTGTDKFDGQFTVAVGRRSTATLDWCTALGELAAATGYNALSLGGFSSANGTGAIGLNGHAQANQLVIGQQFAEINEIIVVGSADFSTGPAPRSGTNLAGRATLILGGKGTGSGAPGETLFQTTTTLGSGTTVQTLSTRARVTATGLSVESGFSEITRTETGATYSIALTDQTIFASGATSKTISLPTATSSRVNSASKVFTIKRLPGSATVSVDVTGGGSIEGAASYALADGESIDVKTDGTDWWLV